MMIFFFGISEKVGRRWTGMIVMLLCLHTYAYTQLFPGLEGEALEEAIQINYTPGELLNDTQVKDTLYAKIFIEGDTVRCIYSGLPRHLPPGVDPSQWLYLTGLEVASMNLEHTWPQAKGAGDGTQGNMDMHHLFPSRSAINSDRGDFPYQEIDDALTQRWYYLDNEMASKPTSNIGAYSEFRSGSFEPRESVKGDIARGMFYFWTIYRQDALAADPSYFDEMKDHLCQWHAQDPVDEFEAMRNERIAAYQDGKQNPFILDCTLAKRTYCEALMECEMVADESVHPADLSLQYLPSDHQIILKGKAEGMWKLVVINVTGQVLFTEMISVNERSSVFDFPPGFYLAWVVRDQMVIPQKFFIP